MMNNFRTFCAFGIAVSTVAALTAGVACAADDALTDGVSTYAGDGFTPARLWRAAPGADPPERLGGLSLEIEMTGWPRLSKRTILALNALVNERWAPAEANFGAVTPFEQLKVTHKVGHAGSSYFVNYAVEPTPTRLRLVKADWVRRTYEYLHDGKGVMEMTATRLSPAVLFKTDQPQLSFFQGITYNGLIDGRVNESPIQIPVTRRVIDYMNAHKGEFPEPKFEEYLIDWDGMHPVTSQEAAKLRDTWGYIKIAYIQIRPIAVAVPEADGVKVYANLGKISLAKQTEPWLLFWFGELSPLKANASPGGRNYPRQSSPSHLPGSNRPLFRPADCPLMLTLQNQPKELVMKPGGVTLRYDGPAGHAAMLAPFGMRFPAPAETEKWRKGLPVSVANLCRWWSQRLGRYPVSVKESYRVAVEGGIEVKSEFDFIDIHKNNAITFSPLPPAVVMAAEAGWPVRISEKRVDAGLLDLYGPLAGVQGVDSYTVTYPSLAEFVETEKVAEPESPSPELAKKLTEHVAEMVTAGHLAPLHGPTGKRIEPPYFFYNPGELVYVLSQCLPYLQGDARSDVLAYLRKEMADYPPLGSSMMPMDKGARREHFMITPEIPARQTFAAQADYHNHWIAPENLHALYTYARQTGDWDYVKAHWPDVRRVARQFQTVADWPTQFYIWPINTGENPLGTGSIADMNNHFTGLIAYARLCRRFGMPDEAAWASYMASRVATARIGMGRLPAVFDRRGGYGTVGKDMLYFSRILQVVRTDTLGPVVDSFMLHHQPAGFIHFLGVNEVTGDLLSKYCRPEQKAYMDAVSREFLWYQTLGLSSMSTSEQESNCPWTPVQVLRAKTWEFGEPQAELAGYIDIPLCKGDLYYLQQLVDVMGADSHKRVDVPAASRRAKVAGGDVEDISLVGAWRFTLDAEAEGVRKGYHRPGFDDSAWAEATVPFSWEEQGYTQPVKGKLPAEYAGTRVTDLNPYNGVGWYRRKVIVPGSWRGRDVYLQVGTIDDFDVTYFNGTKIGLTDDKTNPNDFWRVQRFYRVPAEVIRFGGGNVITVQVIDINDRGGILKRPVQLVARRAGGAD